MVHGLSGVGKPRFQQHVESSCEIVRSTMVTLLTCTTGPRASLWMRSVTLAMISCMRTRRRSRTMRMMRVERASVIIEVPPELKITSDQSEQTSGEERRWEREEHHEQHE